MSVAALQALRVRLLVFLLSAVVVAAVAVGGLIYRNVLHESEALFDYQLQQMALSLRDQGATIQGIADELTRAGVPTRRNGRKWSHSVVRQMFERLGEPKPKSGCGQKRKHRAIVDLRVPFLLGSMNGLNL